MPIIPTVQRSAARLARALVLLGELHLTAPGSINNVCIRRQSTKPGPELLATDITVSVQAAGLNFRDVLNVLGLDPTGTVRAVGGEASGVVTWCGKQAKHVRAGDHVFGLISGGVRSTVSGDARYMAVMPAVTSFEYGSSASYPANSRV